MGNMVRPVNFMCTSPTLYFICCELTSLARNNAVWSTLIMGKAFCKSMYCGFDGVLWVGKEIHILRVIPVRTKHLSFYNDWGQCNQPATRQLVGPLVEWCHLWGLVQALLWQFGCSAVAVARWALEKRKPGCWAHAYLCCYCLFVCELTEQRQGGWGKRWMTPTEWVH